MNTSSIEALASAWAQVAKEADFPADYEGTASPEAHQASEAIQERIREHIVAKSGSKNGQAPVGQNKSKRKMGSEGLF